MSPDITMCRGDECPLRKSCYRFRATPSFWQSYFMTPPYDVTRNDCDNYEYVREKDLIARERLA